MEHRVGYRPLAIIQIDAGCFPQATVFARAVIVLRVEIVEIVIDGVAVRRRFRFPFGFGYSPTLGD